MKLKNFIRKNKWVLLICIIFIILFIGLICLGLNVQNQQVLILHKQSLQTLANEKALHINTFLENQKEKIEILNSMNYGTKFIYPFFCCFYFCSIIWIFNNFFKNTNRTYNLLFLFLIFQKIINLCSFFIC